MTPGRSEYVNDGLIGVRLAENPDIDGRLDGLAALANVDFRASLSRV